MIKIAVCSCVCVCDRNCIFGTNSNSSHFVCVCEASDQCLHTKHVTSSSFASFIAAVQSMILCSLCDSLVLCLSPLTNTIACSRPNAIRIERESMITIIASMVIVMIALDVYEGLRVFFLSRILVATANQNWDAF